jgi:NAD(P)H-dependent FMN reductase/ribosomal protein S18 acetylase RimI-like enzyme
MSTKPLRLLLLVCSTRPGGLGPTIGAWLQEALTQRAEQLGVELVRLALGDLALPFLDEEEHPSSGIYNREHTRRWSSIVSAADGFLVVTPEYNYGMPATLKNALDFLGSEWAWKPMGFVSYGNTSAGTRSVQHAKEVITTLRLVPLGATVAIRIGDSIEAGRVRANPSLTAAAERVLDELVRLSHALRPMRDLDSSTRPGPLPGSYLSSLSPDDAPEAAVLQRCCWVDEAVANGTLAVPALHESVDDVKAWLATWETTGLWRDGRLLGMVRARRLGTDWQVGRLATVPDLRGQGLGSRLLRTAEVAADPACRRIVLTTGASSYSNIGLYQRQGYRIDPSTGSSAGTVTLVKNIGDASFPAGPVVVATV